MKKIRKFSVLIVLILAKLSWAGPEVGRQINKGPTGKNAAAEYFQKNPEPDRLAENSSSAHFLALHFGKLMNSEAWDWGEKGKMIDVGGNTYGFTYRFDEWSQSMDLNLRVDFQEFIINEDRPLKMSIMPMLIFPEANSKFPIYFGIGAGAGVYFKQVRGSSSISFDYQLITGARFFDVFENTGFFIEAGLKNHLHLLSSGQLNSSFLAGGAVFTF